MPELAEVFYHSSRWKESIGESFNLAWVHENTRCCRRVDQGTLDKSLNNAELIGGYTHGKRMMFSFSSDVSLEVHLGMTGSLHRFESDYSEAKHDHLALVSESTVLVFRDPRQFGRIALHENSGGLVPAWWQELPPEPQSENFDKEHFEPLVLRRKGSLLKSLLLKQELFPGVGNWMADEILWRARLRPDRRLGSLNDDELSALFSETKWVCREALRIIGADYSDPPKDWLFSHRWKDGGICPVSNKVLQRESIGGRTTCWSPSIQI